MHLCSHPGHEIRQRDLLSVLSLELALLAHVLSCSVQSPSLSAYVNSDITLEQSAWQALVSTVELCPESGGKDNPADKFEVIFGALLRSQRQARHEQSREREREVDEEGGPGEEEAGASLPIPTSLVPVTLATFSLAKAVAQPADAVLSLPSLSTSSDSVSGSGSDYSEGSEGEGERDIFYDDTRSRGSLSESQASVTASHLSFDREREERLDASLADKPSDAIPPLPTMMHHQSRGHSSAKPRSSRRESSRGRLSARSSRRASAREHSQAVSVDINSAGASFIESENRRVDESFVSSMSGDSYRPQSRGQEDSDVAVSVSQLGLLEIMYTTVRHVLVPMLAKEYQALCSDSGSDQTQSEGEREGESEAGSTAPPLYHPSTMPTATPEASRATLLGQPQGTDAPTYSETTKMLTAVSEGLAGIPGTVLVGYMGMPSRVCPLFTELLLAAPDPGYSSAAVVSASALSFSMARLLMLHDVPEIPGGV
ncbi:hypothetical protein KIPB_004779 [Kipferlia bialata]|uniref:Uncharacterized protein n=1 Tax=Kipferlia bialata TaxID=797122 RepID=A0A9K3CUB6_9EUKA|nr:hypothetical protein KIPB_004779 [Kipferlia bialata]|eukprot:g4779.t1